MEKMVKQFRTFHYNITDENQKRITLLYSAGKRMQEIHNKISTSNNSYIDTVEKLTADFTPAMNIPYACHMFRESTQRSDEITFQYVTRIREQARDCDFGGKQKVTLETKGLINAVVKH